MAKASKEQRRKKVIEVLNKARAMELHAIHQYMNQHYNLDDLDYGELAAKIKLIAIDEMRHDGFVDAAWAAHINVLDAGRLAQRCEPQPCRQLFGIALGCLPIHEQAEALFKAEVFERVTGATLFVQRLGHAGKAKGFEPV